MTQNKATSDDKIIAPFTAEQVIALNRYQQYGFVHPFTCPTVHEEGRDLVATRRGWICPHCDYTQNWAHPSMLKEIKNPLDALKRPVEPRQEGMVMVPTDAERVMAVKLGFSPDEPMSWPMQIIHLFLACPDQSTQWRMRANLKYINWERLREFDRFAAAPQSPEQK